MAVKLQLIAVIIWEGDSLDVLRTFPSEIRQALGAELRRLQVGEFPLHSRPMPSIGARVYELKEQDERAWYRTIYLAKVNNRIHILHCFEKRSAKTSRNDLSIAQTRLKRLSARLLKEEIK